MKKSKLPALNFEDIQKTVFKMIDENWDYFPYLIVGVVCLVIYILFIKKGG